MPIPIGQTRSLSNIGQGAYTTNEKSNLELKLAFNSARLQFYSEYLYDDGKLNEIKIYENQTKTKLMFRKVFIYENDKLKEVTIYRIFPAFAYTQHFIYNEDGSLRSVGVN